jgi:predicted nucleotidyltransferase
VNKDFADSLDSLNGEDALYVVIGGMAVLSLVPYRTTRDLDVLIEPTLDNAHRVRAAVRNWRGIEPRFSAIEFISGDVLSFGALLRVEVHSRVAGANWRQVWERRVQGELLGVRTQFASLDDLIAMKEAAGRREKDLPDLRRLRRLRSRSKP